MEGKVNLAWAIEVDSAQLGARLEAYVETKAAVAALRARLSRYRLPPKGRIPERTIPREIIDLITDAVQDADYEPRIRAWTKSRRCAQNKCDTVDHFTQEDINAIRGGYLEPWDYYPPWLFTDSCLEHGDRKRPFLEKITKRRGVRFARIKETFMSEFNICPFYTVLGAADVNGDLRENGFPVRISAYLASPLANAPIETEPGIEKAFYTVQHRVDTAAISQEPSPSVQESFKKAVKALRLEVRHTKIRKVVAEEDDPGSDSSSLGQSGSDVDMTGSADEFTEENEDDPEDLDCGSEDRYLSQESSMPLDEWGRYGKYRPYCIDCGDRVCQGRYQAPEPVLMMLASGEMEAYSAED